MRRERERGREKCCHGCLQKTHMVYKYAYIDSLADLLEFLDESHQDLL